MATRHGPAKAEMGNNRMTYRELEASVARLEAVVLLLIQLNRARTFTEMRPILEKLRACKFGS